MVLVCAACGLTLFVYIHVFSYRRLRHQDRHLDREEARADRAMMALPEATTQPAVVGMAPAQAEAALFYLYQEQVRRFIDAKIDIMRSAAETQNRILVIQAETVRNAAALPAPHMPSPHMIEINGDGSAALPARLTEAAPMVEQLHTVRTETERHLAEIDQQIRSLPGPSLTQWTTALNEL